jgi:hypothetical protein
LKEQLLEKWNYLNQIDYIAESVREKMSKYKKFATSKHITKEIWAQFSLWDTVCVSV